MPTALIISSFVAAGRVGGMAQALALAALKIEPVLIPTVVFGRTPGPRGPGGGAAVEPHIVQAMIDGAAADGLFGRVDAVITGHFSHPDQVAIAARVIDLVRTAPRSGGFIPVPVVVVDPILGDAPGGLYVKPEVAEAVQAELLTRADVLTPNLWELGWLTGVEALNAAGARTAAQRLPAPALITSVPAREGEIALLYAGAGEATLIAHARLEGVPKGTGDLVTAVFAAGLIEGHAPVEAAARAARAAATITRAAVEKGLAELPIVALGPGLIGEAAEIRIERLSP
jgi:pyridoxine kinase